MVDKDITFLSMIQSNSKYSNRINPPHNKIHPISLHQVVRNNDKT